MTLFIKIKYVLKNEVLQFFVKFVLTNFKFIVYIYNNHFIFFQSIYYIRGCLVGRNPWDFLGIEIQFPQNRMFGWF